MNSNKIIELNITARNGYIVMGFTLLCIATFIYKYQSNISQYNVTIRAPKPMLNLKWKTKHNDEMIVDPWMMEMENKYMKDNERIKTICKKISHKPKSLPLKWFGRLWSDTRHKVVGCLNNKVGSSTWKSHFYNLLPKEERTKLEKKFGPPYHRYSIIRLFGC